MSEQGLGMRGRPHAASSPSMPSQGLPGPFPRIDASSTTDTDIPETTSTPPGQTISEVDADVFETKESSTQGSEGDVEPEDPAIKSHELPERFDELPIELISLADRFVSSLSARIYSTPPSIDRLSDLFQEFYARANTHITTHVSTLASRLNRDHSPSPTPSQTSKSSKRTSGSRASSQKELDRIPSEQQMLTASEVAERRKARKLLQLKHHALEEAVERRVCEAIYEKIWRHRSTMDDVRDEKLRSKTAALLVMGIELKDLGVVISKETKENDDTAADPKEWLAAASQYLVKMDEEKYPLGKLQHLVAAHNAIVDALTNILSSSSSADEILPTLIYTLILSPPEGINIISNLNFIQRFRTSSKIDGEAAYCLTNLEAAIGFLENVDLSSLRSEDGLSGSNPPPTDSSPPTDPFPNTENHDHRHPLNTSSAPSTTTVDTTTSRKPTATLSVPSAPSAQQRLSNLFQPPAKALGAANDIVRNTADQGLKNISSTLDNSFKFLFGRLNEVQVHQAQDAQGDIPIVPKTLEDARRLVRKASGLLSDETMSETGSTKSDPPATTTSNPTRQRLDDRLAELVAGRRRPAARSDSVTTTSSTETKLTTESQNNPVIAQSALPPTPNPGFGSVRGLGNSLNPLNHIPSMIRGLGRNAAEPAQLNSSDDKTRMLAERHPNVRKKTSASSFTQPGPPIQKFVDMKDPSELKLGDVPELLEDYKRIATALIRLQNSNV
ncbi:hypothetical protein FQN57_005481 [Myotisia sp. PD_48]|nr:hypothetical protein FQN57_005481 [Myotisia sp. PD_48]